MKTGKFEERWWTKAELAERWKCTVRHVERIISSKALGMVKHFGRCVRIAHSNVMDYENGGNHV